MAAEELDIKELLTQLQKTNSSVGELTNLVKAQANTIEELKAGVKAPVTPPATTDEYTKQLEDKLNKSIETNNKYMSDQRKEKLDRSVEEGLVARGIDPKKLQYVKAFIKDKVFTDKAGNMKMTDLDGNENTLEAGLDNFVESEHGNEFRAPAPINGGGMQPFHSPNRPGSKLQTPKPSDRLSDNDFNKLIQKSLGN